jgi:hypothetical protein
LKVSKFDNDNTPRNDLSCFFSKLVAAVTEMAYGVVQLIRRTRKKIKGGNLNIFEKQIDKLHLPNRLNRLTLHQNELYVHVKKR